MSIESEIEKLDKILNGFHYYLRQTNNSNKEIGNYLDYNIDTLDDAEYRQKIGPQETINSLLALLQKLREKVKSLGVSEYEITDEKLLGYADIQHAEVEEDTKEISKLRREGKSPAQAMLNTLFNTKKH